MWSFIVCALRANIVRMMKSRRMIWAGHVSSMRDTNNTSKNLVNLMERDHLRDQGLDVRMILK
jgi:hypothetical protein